MIRWFEEGQTMKFGSSISELPLGILTLNGNKAAGEFGLQARATFDRVKEVLLVHIPTRV